MTINTAPGKEHVEVYRIRRWEFYIKDWYGMRYTRVEYDTDNISMQAPRHGPDRKRLWLHSELNSGARYRVWQLEITWHEYAFTLFFRPILFVYYVSYVLNSSNSSNSPNRVSVFLVTSGDKCRELYSQLFSDSILRSWRLPMFRRSLISKVSCKEVKGGKKHLVDES